MNQHEIPKGSTRAKKRVGRGEGNGHGKTCGRGHKGAKARAGYSLRAGFEGGQMPLFRKLPRRGFNNARFRKHYAILNIEDLDKITGGKVDLQSAKDAGLVRANATAIKLLANGELDRALHVKVDKCSLAAQEKIKSAGGSVEIV